MAQFLSDDWFTQVDKLSEEAGDLNLPPALANMNLNLKVDDGSDTIDANVSDGRIRKGLNDNATTTLLMDKQTLQDLAQDFEMNSAMSAFMGGKIRVEGDMSQLMALQSASASDEQKQLFDNIKTMTEYA